MDPIITCPPTICWSETVSAKRQKAATLVFGKAVVARIIGFAMFLLGANREQIAQTVGMPLGTFLSFLTRMSHLGLSGLDDRRQFDSAPVRASVTLPALEPATSPEPVPGHLAIEIKQQGEDAVISLPNLGDLVLKKDNPMQCKVIALTLANHGILTWEQAADLLNYSSPAYVQSLGDSLSTGDVEAIFDQRAGQTWDYRVGDREKGLLILQWTANVVTGAKCSSRALVKDLKKYQDIILSDRTVRTHMKKLGLVGMQKTLSSLLDNLKKTSVS